MVHCDSCYYKYGHNQRAGHTPTDKEDSDQSDSDVVLDEDGDTWEGESTAHDILEL